MNPFRVLYLNHPESDYGGAFIYNGLCRVLNAKNVFDFPIKWSYHGVNHEYSTPSIKDGKTNPLPWMPNYPCAWHQHDPNFDEDNFVEYVRKLIREGFFSLVVVESCRVIAFESFKRFQDVIKIVGIPVVSHDGEDYTDERTAELTVINPSVHLKREISLVHPAATSVRTEAFPFSFPDTARTLDAVSRSKSTELESFIDVVFMCGGTWDYRLEVMSRLAHATDLNSLLATDSTNKPKVGVPVDGKPIRDLYEWFSYIESIRKAKIGVSVRGFGWDTCRFWETAAATLLATQPLDMVIPNPYTPNFNCLEFSSPDDLIQQVRGIKDDRERLEKLKTECVNHTLRYHTNSARIHYLFNLLGISVPNNE